MNVGAGNPGAIGINYLANNRGAIRNVVVKAPAGSGRFGIEMTRNETGPCLLQDVRVTGFDVGIDAGFPLVGVTLEDIALGQQRVAGLLNNKMVLSIENLTSTNTVPAIVNTGSAGFVTVIGGSLVGGSHANPAIDNRQGGTYLEGVTTSGYRVALRNHGTDVGGHSIRQYTSGRARSLFSTSSRQALTFPIEYPPTVSPGPPSGWANMKAYGASQNRPDNSSAIEAALNSGKRTVYFPPGEYEIRHTVTVRSGVNIIGFNSTLSGTHGEFATRPRATLSCASRAPPAK